MANRVFNFSAGPAVLPLPVLERVREAVVDFNGIGASLMEISHRSKEFSAVHAETKALMAELLNLPENYHVIFMGGGASTQFATIPMNVLGKDQSADYILTGTWSKKAIKEAKRFGNTRVAATTEVEGRFRSIPKQADLDLDPNARYVHMTTNNTISSTQFKELPEVGDVPLVADMSSDILSGPMDITKFDYVYAGAQKNLGPSGVTVGIISDRFLAMCDEDVPTMLSYHTHVKKDSLFNTPPTLPIFVVGEVLRWIKDMGGLEAMQAHNEKKAGFIYGVIDELSDFYTGPAEKDSRSLMNIAFRLPTEELEAKFLVDAAAKGMVTLKGHRSVGGIRASVYNAMPMEGAETLAQFMRDFAKANG